MKTQVSTLSPVRRPADRHRESGAANGSHRRPQSSRIRIVVVDDHPITLAGLNSLLSGERDFVVVARCVDAYEAVRAVRTYEPDVVVVDQDVNIFDDRQVTWAIATRCQPDRDITIVTGARGSDLDPSTREDGYSGKWGIDATAKPSLAGYTPRHRVPPEVWKRLDLKDYAE